MRRQGEYRERPQVFLWITNSFWFDPKRSKWQLIQTCETLCISDWYTWNLLQHLLWPSQAQREHISENMMSRARGQSIDSIGKIRPRTTFCAFQQTPADVERNPVISAMQGKTGQCILFILTAYFAASLACCQQMLLIVITNHVFTLEIARGRGLDNLLAWQRFLNL